MFEKIWSRHVVAEGPGGHALLYIDRHLLHEGTTAAFGRLARSGRRVRRPDLSFATTDHYLSTSPGSPTGDAETRGMVEALGRHMADQRILYFGVDDPRRGIVHVTGPEQGLTVPGITLVCGDSHTATHGAFGARVRHRLERGRARAGHADLVAEEAPENCFKSGLLPVILPAEAVVGLRRQLHERPGATLTVDLETQTVTAPDGAEHRFEVDAFRKEMLLTGRDEIGLTLGFEAKIVEFEARHAREMAWTVPPRPGT